MQDDEFYNGDNKNAEYLYIEGRQRMLKLTQM